MKKQLLLGLYLLVPAAGFCVSLSLMTSCAFGGGSLEPGTSGTKTKSAPPAFCPSNTIETNLGDGQSWCCQGDHCDEKGSPVYQGSCVNAGERKTGTIYTFAEATCASSQGVNRFKRAEQWVNVTYECRSEDGINPRWEYVEPSSQCTRKLARQCTESTDVTVTIDERVGNACP